MKKILTLIPVFAMLLLVSCEQHVLDYDATPVDQTTQAQIRVAYDVGVITPGSNITSSYPSQMVLSISASKHFPNSAANYLLFRATIRNQFRYRIYKRCSHITGLLTLLRQETHSFTIWCRSFNDTYAGIVSTI